VSETLNAWSQESPLKDYVLSEALWNVCRTLNVKNTHVKQRAGICAGICKPTGEAEQPLWLPIAGGFPHRRRQSPRAHARRILKRAAFVTHASLKLDTTAGHACCREPPINYCQLAKSICSRAAEFDSAKIGPVGLGLRHERDDLRWHSSRVCLLCGLQEGALVRDVHPSAVRAVPIGAEVE